MNVEKTNFLYTSVFQGKVFIIIILQCIDCLGGKMKKSKWGILSATISRWLDRIIVAVQEAIGTYNIETATKIRVRKFANKVD
jgi:hypothetical protein